MSLIIRLALCAFAAITLACSSDGDLRTSQPSPGVPATAAAIRTLAPSATAPLPPDGLTAGEAVSLDNILQEPFSYPLRFVLDKVTGDAYHVGLANPAGDDVVRRSANTSASGRWDAWTLASGAGGVVFEEGEGNERATWHVSAAAIPVWAPSADLLAMQGNLCDFDVLVLDPVTRELRNLTPELPAAPHFTWSPDSASLAVFVQDAGGVALQEISLDGTPPRTMASASVDLTLIPLGWSDDGRYLIVQFDPLPFALCDVDGGGPSRVDQNFGGP